MKVCEVVARWFAQNHFDTAYGIVGGGNLHLWDAITRLGKTRLVSVHHEQAAAMAAAFHWRASGRPAVCLVTTGAGSANAFTGALSAHFDYIPLLVISGNEASRFMDDERVLGTQGFRPDRVYEDVLLAAWQLEQDEMQEVAGLLDDGWALAREAHGVVWIDFPKDLQTAEAG